MENEENVGVFAGNVAGTMILMLGGFFVIFVMCYAPVYPALLVMMFCASVVPTLFTLQVLSFAKYIAHEHASKFSLGVLIITTIVDIVLLCLLLAPEFVIKIIGGNGPNQPADGAQDGAQDVERAGPCGEANVA